MRTVLFVFVVIMASAVHAQTIVPGTFSNFGYRSFGPMVPAADSASKSKWSLNKYAALSTGYSFFKGGNAMVVSAPIGLQLNRRLNNNLYAFAGVAVAPTYTNFNSNFIGSNFSKTGAANNAFSRTGNFGMSSRVELGLMYVNDARTFSISGSIGVEKGTNMYRSYPISTSQQTPVAAGAFR